MTGGRDEERPDFADPDNLQVVYECLACPLADTCKRHCFKRANCWSYHGDEAVRTYVAAHLRNSELHAGDPDCSDDYKINAIIDTLEIHAREETIEEREAYRRAAAAAQARTAEGRGGGSASSEKKCGGGGGDEGGGTAWGEGSERNDGGDWQRSAASDNDWQGGDDRGDSRGDGRGDGRGGGWQKSSGKDKGKGKNKGKGKGGSKGKDWQDRKRGHDAVAVDELKETVQELTQVVQQAVSNAASASTGGQLMLQGQQQSPFGNVPPMIVTDTQAITGVVVDSAERVLNCMGNVMTTCLSTARTLNDEGNRLRASVDALKSAKK